MDEAQAVYLGLFVAWCINDAEELVTLADSSRLVAERAPAFLPLPEAFRRGGFSKKHTYHGIATMGVLVGTASLAGYVTHGRSPLFRGALVTFGAHGCTHVASALAASAWVMPPSENPGRNAAQGSSTSALSVRNRPYKCDSQH